MYWVEKRDILFSYMFVDVYVLNPSKYSTVTVAFLLSLGHLGDLSPHFWFFLSFLNPSK